VRFSPLTFGDRLADPVTKKPARSDLGQPDTIGYERSHLALALAGATNKLRPTGYRKELN
jgi:hypothetical protein